MANRFEKSKQKLALREKEMALKKATKHKDLKKLHKKQKQDDEEEWEDVDEHEKDVFDKDGYFDVPDQ